MTFLIKTFFFVFLGAMLGPPWRWAAFGVAVGVLLFVARIPAVLLGSLGSDLDASERRLATVALPRGLAAGVLAVVPLTAGVPATAELPVIVYSAIVTSIVLFAIGFKMFRPRAGSVLPASSAPASSAPASSAPAEPPQVAGPLA